MLAHSHTSSSSSDKNVLRKLGQFMLHRKACSCALSPPLPVGVSETGSALPFLWPKCFQAGGRTSPLILPCGGRSPWSAPDSREGDIDLFSGLLFPITQECVSVRKLNLLLAPCTPITHYLCKLIPCSCNCKFPFSMTMQALLGIGKGLLPACSWPPSTIPFQQGSKTLHPGLWDRKSSRGGGCLLSFIPWIFILRSTSHEAKWQR